MKLFKYIKNLFVDDTVFIIQYRFTNVFHNTGSNPVEELIYYKIYFSEFQKRFTIKIESKGFWTNYFTHTDHNRNNKLYFRITGAIELLNGSLKLKEITSAEAIVYIRSL